MNENYKILIKKLDDFIKKYYLNKIIKGVLLAITVYITWYLIIVIAEYFGRFSSVARTVLFTLTIVLYFIIFIRMIIIPVLNLFKIGKTINHKQAGTILGQYFPEVADKLQNTLELKEIAENDSEVNDLVLASINQRTIKLSPVPFLSAINLRSNLKYLKYLLPVSLIIAVLFILWPGIISEATERIIKFDQHFEAPAPFSFTLLNDSLSVRKGDDFTIKVKAAGNYSPDRVLLSYGGNEFYMEQESPGVFNYQIKNLNNDISFKFKALDIESQPYRVSVLQAPIIVDFKVIVKSPAYTGIEDRTYNNSGDFAIAAGSDVFWSFNTASINTLSARFDTINIKAVKNGTEYSFKKKILKSVSYTINVKNDYFDENTGINYQINVIPDLYPSIRVKGVVDTSELSVYYFNGFIDDDYGFTALNFNYIPGEKSDTLVKIAIPFAKTISSQDFYFAFDFSKIDVIGRNISYYFEVADNDGINGAKISRTQMMEFTIPTAEDLQRITEEANKDTESKIDEAKDISKKLRKDIEELQKKLLNEELSSWERTQMLQQIFDSQNKLDNLMDQIKKEQSNVHQMKEQFSKNEDLLKKQEEINKLMESLMDDEMRKLMEELQKLMEEFKKDEFFEIAEDIKLNSEEMEKQMDNTLELLKKTEVEERLKNTIDNLEELAKEHDKLSEMTKDKKTPQEELVQKQKEHEEEFNKIKEDYEKTLEKNSELKEPMKLDDFEEDANEIMENFEQTKEDLQDKKNSKASKSQKENSDKMKQMAQDMQAQMDAEAMDQMAENIDDIRQVIENLLTFSFTQEEILLGQKSLGPRDPRFREYIVTQKNAQDNFNIIKDSLNAMSARIPELGPLVNQEISSITKNLREIMSEINDNRRYKVEAAQQLVMTSANNLALLLLEMMEQMMQQMAMQMKGDGQCNNCKNKGQGSQMGEMRDMQQGLKEQMQNMIDQMKDGGKNPGGKQSEQLAKMLMQQEMMQQMMQDLMNSGISPESAKILNEINRMMDQNLKDIVGGNITPTTINRQEQILTRLLQAENSEREREIDNKRKSNEAKDYKISNPEKAFKEKEKEIRFNELLQLSNLKLNSYYNNKYKEYLKQLGQQ